MKKEKPPLVVIGGGDSLFADITALSKLVKISKCHVIAVNDAIASWPRHLHFACSLHPEEGKLPLWLARRTGNRPISFSTRGESGFYPDHIVAEKWGGSSGLYACQIGLGMEYSKIVLCGVPMTPSINLWTNAKFKSVHHYHKGWRDAYPFLNRRVFSMSGWTRDLLGNPQF